MNSSHDVLLNDGQAKRKVSKLVGSWAVANNQAKSRRARPDGRNSQIHNLPVQSQGGIPVAYEPAP